MKKTTISLKSLSLSLLCTMIALLPMLSSCTKEKTANVADLLSTVPSSAGIVVGVNLSSMLEKTGCKIENNSINPGKEIKDIFASSQTNSAQADIIKTLLSGESGIDPVGAVFFADAYNSYITAALADTEKFCDFIVKQTEIPFQEAEGNVRISGNVAVSGAQMWVSLNPEPIDPKAVKNYTTLDQTQSFVSLPVASAISTMTHDIVGYGQISSIVGKRLSVSDNALLSLVSAFIFDSPSALSFNLDFLKGELKGKAMILNAKGDPAKCLLPLKKIDTNMVKNLSTTANAAIALSLPKDLIAKVSKMAEPLGANLLKVFTSSVEALDGTTAVVINSTDTYLRQLSAVVSTNGNPPLDMMQILATYGNTRKDGKLVYVSRGEVNGSLETAMIADKFKGASFALAANAESGLDFAGRYGTDTSVISLCPESGSLSINIWADTPEKDKNILLPILTSLLK